MKRIEKIIDRTKETQNNIHETIVEGGEEYKLLSEEDWGYYIDCKSFAFKLMKSEIPEKDFIVVKESFEIPNVEVNSYKTHYYQRNEGILTKFDKRSFTKLISKEVIKFCLENNKLPKTISLKKEPEKKKAAHLLLRSNEGKYDSFHLRITAEMLDDKEPFELFSKLKDKEASRPGARIYEEWKIEYSNNSGATCKTCNAKIMKGEIRLGEPYQYQGNLNYMWHHWKCKKRKKTIKYLVGVETLSEEDQKKVKIDRLKRA